VKPLSTIINASSNVRVTDVYYTLGACRKGLSHKQPDILLLDIAMPDGNGLDFCVEILKIYPRLRIIMLTAYEEFNIAKYALSYGALGYILKKADPDEIFEGIKKVYRGEQFLCKEINLLLREDQSESDSIWLTNVEQRVLQLRAEGYTLKQISDILCRDEETIKTHMRNIRVKFGVKNTIQAINTGYRLNLISL
jgi:DNA-binding NarL/FixJ family response regulator